MCGLVLVSCVEWLPVAADMDCSACMGVVCGVGVGVGLNFTVFFFPGVYGDVVWT